MRRVFTSLITLIADAVALPGFARGAIVSAPALPVLVLGVAVSALSALPGPALADVFGPIVLVSTSATQQADYAHDPAISGDGRYVAFDGSFGGVTGVWRKDLQTGAVEAVAVADPSDPAVSAPDAELPSISENGQYVSFTTTARLDPVDDTNEGPDVYVRNMEIPVYPAPSSTSPAPAGAFTLASAVNGSTQGLTYEPSWGLEPMFEAGHYGSVASGRTALSANGNEVAFVTSAVSNLDGPHTPALQVAVRNLAARTTQLVSVAYNPATGKPAVNPATGAQEPVSGEESGLVYGGAYAPSLPPPAFRAPAGYTLQSPLGVSISADGTTVAWIGQDIAQQAPVLAEEALPFRYSEPLWRRIADGAEAPTRRITGGSDPANPACAASGETILPPSPSPSDPCQGPFATEALGVWIGGVGDPVPQLSADGSVVAFLAGAPPVGAIFGEVLNRASDLYVARMEAGLTRDEAQRPLTELASGKAEEQATTAPIVDLGISPDGSEVAFTTQRTVFPLGSPAYISVPAAIPGMVELFDVDLANDTLTRVTHGFAGGAGEAPHGTEVSGQDPYTDTDGALSPSFSDDGDLLAFSSTAANLVYGDGNTPQQPNNPVFDGSDAFVIPREVFGAQPTPQSISSAPASPPLAPSWRLQATAASLADGTVLLEVQTPGTGTLRVGTQSAVRVERSKRANRLTRGKHASTHNRGASATVAERTVATRQLQAPEGGLVIVTLKLAKPYSALANARGGLSGTANLTFSAHGQPTLHESLAVTFARSLRSPRAHKRSTGAKRHAKKGARR